MVSLPDDLLESLDAEAARRGTTRSGLLRRYVDDALRARAQVRANRIDRLVGGGAGHGGDGLAQLKRRRPRP
jgi:metal-responsive CopG/Arc/MetJ family transcriptional regulator